ncbi:MAG: DsbA family oxidoreductase [Propionicimonas sp.]|uniref:DsbA family oxidoreductase n=1 Tax=Propionicimonas sp. TaxID=1955623 RepID=UPI002B1FDE1F|nr:DsbA family oxidoreductase [Propionicimonas sp.]MEA4943978.1 DsbA family oxidoreductase [Propionicimonas sp.]MEA5053779.1 DsbA family oxidoreductase [Propionicimonas sp.]MEA5118861.1 DsbA family oxidoreductase [Propionicimonas sp.]
MSEPVKVDIWSDVQCPWCYIGKRKFEAAVAGFDGEVEVEYHSFELSPDTPVDYDGTPVQYLAERKGLPTEQVEQMIGRVTQIAAAVGLDYDYDTMHQTNTVKAHELLHYAKAHGRQAAMKEALLKAYFIDGGHVGRLDDLADLAASLGFDRADVLQALESGQYADAVKADVAQARAYGINGVPFYVFEGKYGVSGAQETATFAQVLQQVADEKAAA